jgi:uncharacterized protein (TIGR00369 family)
MTSKTTEIFADMFDKMSAAGVEIPPKCYKEMGGEVIDFNEKDYIKIAFPVQEKYSNPAGNLLGGMIPAFFDNTFGPLSYLLAKKPTVSLDLNTTFIKPISPKEGELIIEAKAIKITKRFIIFEGKAYNPSNELIATGTSRMMILG